MDTIVYFVRHGTTDNNIGGRFQGKSDIPLGETGRKQAACLGRRFAHTPLDAVYSSPLLRAWQTAQGVCEQLPIQPVACDDLREIDGGLLEGQTNADNIKRYPDVMHAFRHDPSKFCPPQGECARTVHERTTAAMWRIVKENRGKTVAIVSHGFALLCSLGCLRVPFEQLRPEILVNASVSRVRFHDDGTYDIELYNDQSHLTEDCIFHSPFWKEPK